MVEIQDHFNDWANLIRHYEILPENCWNFDEIGFRIGCLRGRFVIVPCDVKAVYLADPDNRESVTALEYINVVGQAIEPILITKGE